MKHNIAKIVYPAFYAFVAYMIFNNVGIFHPGVYLSTEDRVLSFFPFILGGLVGVLVFKYVNKMKPDLRGSILCIAFIFIFHFSDIPHFNFFDLWKFLALIISYIVFTLIFFRGYVEKDLPLDETHIQSDNLNKIVLHILPTLGLIGLVLITMVFQFFMLLGGMGKEECDAICSIIDRLYHPVMLVEIMFVLSLFADLIKPWIPVSVKKFAAVVFIIFLVISLILFS